MYDLLSLLTGALIAVMVTFNGVLTKYCGIFGAAVVIHVVGNRGENARFLEPSCQVPGAL